MIDLRDHIDLPEKEYSYHTTDLVKGLFGGELLDYYEKGNYHGECASLWKISGIYVVISDYFGSCSVCDKALSADDVDKLAIKMASSARKFDTIDELREFLNGGCEEAENYAFEHASNLKIPTEDK